MEKKTSTKSGNKDGKYYFENKGGKRHLKKKKKRINALV